jgi:hypothetical protein
MSKTVQTTKGAGGRPKGAVSNTTRARTLSLAQAEVKPLDVLLQTMAERWKSSQAAIDPEERAQLQVEACAVAEKVAPYLHPKLQATTIKGDADNPLSFAMSLPTADALRAMVRGTDTSNKG